MRKYLVRLASQNIFVFRILVVLLIEVIECVSCAFGPLIVETIVVVNIIQFKMFHSYSQIIHELCRQKMKSSEYLQSNYT